MPNSTVIIPVFNHAALTEQCLRIVCEGGGIEILVIDDGSNDETRRVLRTFRGKIEVISHKSNRGFAASCNEAAKAATGDYLVFLNNDTLPQPGWLEALQQEMAKHPEVAIVGSKLLYPNETVQHAGVVICQDCYPRHIYTGFPANHPAVTKSRRFQIVTGACMLVRRRVFEELGGFDPAFRNGFEDVDLCLRAGERGEAVLYCANSVVHHLESMSPGRFNHNRDNVTLYRQRWFRRVRPDDLQYYLEDDLLRLTYEGHFPIGLEVSPLLATLNGVRGAEVERLLQERTRQVMELSREVTRLTVELGNKVENSSVLHYQQLRRRVHEAVQKVVPPGGTVAVISKGDGALLNFPKHEGWHFPQTERGAYAGHHPADSAEAIAHLEALRAKGAQYLLIPDTSMWWLDHYPDFRRHLDTHYAPLQCPEQVCSVYALSSPVAAEKA